MVTTATGGSGNLVGVPRNWLCHDQRRSFEARFTRGGAGDARLHWMGLFQRSESWDLFRLWEILNMTWNAATYIERWCWYWKAWNGALIFWGSNARSIATFAETLLQPVFDVYLCMDSHFLPILVGHITLYHNMLAQKEMTLKTCPLFLGWVPHSCILVEKYPYYRLSPFYSVEWLSHVPPVYFNGDILAVFGWTLPTLHSSGEIYRNSPGFLPVQNDSICTISFRVKKWVLEFGYTYI